MLLEALNFLGTFTSSPRRMSAEINASVMLWARARRCRRDWAHHEQNCQDFIRKVVGQLERRRVVVILGSGLLRDVPIEELSEQFERVVLVDLQHLASVRIWTRLKHLTNLEFVNRDFSGIAELVESPDQAPEPLEFLNDIKNLDFVISANVLSQIGVGLTRLKESEAAALPRFSLPQLLAAHVDGLERLGCPACLLTDTSYKVQDRSGAVTEEDDLLYGISLPAAAREWDWTLIPYGEQSPHWSAIHRVVAINVP